MDKIREFNKKQLKKDLPEIRPGYAIRVHQKIKEGDKRRKQIFEGLVIAKKHGNGINGTITVRRTTSGVGVERIFPIHAPFIEKIEVIRKHKVRRAKLYYIRHKSTKESRLKEIEDKPKVEKEIEKKIETEEKEISSEK